MVAGLIILCSLIFSGGDAFPEESDSWPKGSSAELVRKLFDGEGPGG
jgi:hypothetical protein